ncbi:lycopene cyclase domain-containing protein [Chryseobacterium koreense]|uniref:Lycopene cyclase n=1 Tax=Chryseobacterium koreense CCUG 49689 TaxID=1304281 RepID=A0A0J7J0C5_9FLAO|nr:lycopene cyclase domain-containing protein [Chryseobacterium koreense]KMQ71898.1 lycopene cyclase [Chryseobacterium koreense CCUG 49689]MBB5334142.1 lycopene cyclase domain-containing protein [Chryseobacterium koreense]
MRFTYSLILFFTVIICLIASFDKRISFNRHFAAFFKAAILVAVPFIAWDIYFTSIGVWWFNTDYTLGIKIAGLPLEEILFFIFIPFSCIFTYFTIDKYYPMEILAAFNNILVFASVIILSVVALVNVDKIYTLVTAIVTIATLIYLHFIARAEWITKASAVFLLLMLGFFPVNGILTGSFIAHPIVNYNPKEFLGIRMFTIPVEDAVYGYAQFLLVLFFFKQFQKQQHNENKNHF